MALGYHICSLVQLAQLLDDGTNVGIRLKPTTCTLQNKVASNIEGRVRCRSKVQSFIETTGEKDEPFVPSLKNTVLDIG